MTTPAVLYDHVPLTDEELKIFASSVSATPSAPSCFLANGGDDNNCDGAEDDDDEATMETIMEDSSTEYVLISYETPHIVENYETIDSDGTITDVTQHITPTTSIEAPTPQTNGGLWNMVNRVYQSTRTAMVSSCSSLVQKRNSSTIYSSYDWVSNTTFDETGTRLILPGQLIVLGEDDASDPPMYDLHGQYIDNGNAPRASRTSSHSPNTIMVSAYDLLATQAQARSIVNDVDQDEDYQSRIREEEGLRELAWSSSTIPWSQKLWKIAKRRATRKFLLAKQKAIPSVFSYTCAAASTASNLPRLLSTTTKRATGLWNDRMFGSLSSEQTNACPLEEEDDEVDENVIHEKLPMAMIELSSVKR